MPLSIRGSAECRPAPRPDPKVEFKLVCRKGEIVLRSYVEGKKFNLLSITKAGLVLRSHNDGCGIQVGHGGYVLTTTANTPPRSASERSRRYAR